MAQGFNLDEMDPAFVMEILTGIEGQLDPVAGEVFDFQPVTTMSGDIPFIASKHTLASSDDTELGKVPFDADPQTQDAEVSTVSFEFDGKYAEGHEVHETDVEAMADIDTDQDLVEKLGEVVLMKIAAGFDLDVASLLQSTTQNNTVSAQAAWSNPSSADPLEDFDAAVDEVGNPDLAWLGENKARDLAGTDAMKAEAKQYQATNARVKQSTVAQELMDRYGLRDVVIDGTLYNQNNPGQTLNTAKIFDDTAWVGNSDHFVIPERPEFERADSDFTSKSGMYEVWAQFYLELARVEGNQGVVITGT